MRTTVQIDDDLMRELRSRAHLEGTSLTKLINRVLRQGIQAMRKGNKPARRYREKTFSMGEPKVDLDRALALAAAMEDEEIRRKLAQRK